MLKKKRKYCPYCGKSIINKNEGDMVREYCPECQLFFYNNPLPVVSTIVVKERNVLLVKRRNPPYKGKWCLPSGFAEIGESIQEAALRELKEEAGIDGMILGFVDVNWTKNYYYGDLIFHTFEVEQTGGITKAGDDAIDVKYFPINGLPKLAFKSNIKAIETYIKKKRRDRKMKIVYSYYVLDLVHKGHLKMMENAKAIAGKDGKLIVGILTDEAVMEKKIKPIISFDERFDLANAIKYVDLVVAQETYSPLPNVKKIKPDILMESTSHTDEAIEEANEVMESIGGEVIVIPYYPSQSSTNIKNKINGRD